MTEMELYQSWRKNAIDDPDLQSELSAIENHQILKLFFLLF